AQHIWCYINGELKMESDCVSGMTSDGHATPTGVFGIMFMKKDATLRGIMQKNGKYEYETKVAYWMPFYDGCGFHDAWWRTAFGGDIYIKDGSHGCINLPVDAAKELFSYCDVKMPVVVYE
ncbi:MAG: L,D-transpeptidase, partial [Eubacteriales bacterium]|nr:L,D-transpeptidase [Eubacteriales bacterium]